MHDKIFTIIQFAVKNEKITVISMYIPPKFPINARYENTEVDFIS